VHMLAFCQVNVLNEYDDDDDMMSMRNRFHARSVNRSKITIS